MASDRHPLPAGGRGRSVFLLTETLVRTESGIAMVTFQILEGMERGRVLDGLEPPLTIGREEDNAVQLNDERVSRFHAKVQENGGQIILTDLASTNGTRVNGHPVQIHVLRVGDQISIGRCLLLYGSPEQIEQRLKSRRALLSESPGGTVTFDGHGGPNGDSTGHGDDLDLPRMFPDGPPDLPTQLRPLQIAQLADVLAHLHDRLHSVLECAAEQGGLAGEQSAMVLDWTAWQRLLKIEMDLATYLRRLSGDGSGPG